MDLREAIEATLDAMDESFILYDYIQTHREEVIAMLDTEFKEEEYKGVIYNDAFRDGEIKGKAEGIEQGSRQMYVETLQEVGKGYEDTILKFAEKFNVSMEQSEENVRKYWK